LRETWFTDSTLAERRRQEYQNYMECCGFEYITDSQPETDCDGGWTIPCKTATVNVLSQYLGPVSAAAVAIAVIELLSLGATCAIIMTRSAEVVDAQSSPFSY